MYDDIYGTDGAVYVKTYIHIYTFVTGSQTAEESEPDFQWKCEKIVDIFQTLEKNIRQKIACIIAAKKLKEYSL